MAAGLPVISAELPGGAVSLQGGSFENVTATHRFHVANNSKVFSDVAVPDVLDVGAGSTIQSQSLESIPSSLMFLSDSDEFVAGQEQVRHSRPFLRHQSLFLCLCNEER